jgi:hypothetical protein
MKICSTESEILVVFSLTHLLIYSMWKYVFLQWVTTKKVRTNGGKQKKTVGVNKIYSSFKKKIKTVYIAHQVYYSHHGHTSC